jgi:dTDP-4-amino-4,6-dideoxygalactose transaminase
MDKWPFYSKDCRAEVDSVLRSGTLTAFRANPKVGLDGGPKVVEFERLMAKYLGVHHVVATNSGTAALHCALYGLNLPKGSEVIVPPFTFSATVSAVVMAGLEPVFADVDPFRYTLDPNSVKKVLTRRTKAILPVHLFGGLADTEGLKEFGLPIVADFCQSVGSVYRDDLGIVGAASCNGAKNLPCGEFGFAVTGDDEIAERMKLLRNHGENWQKRDIGFNYRPSEIHAVIAKHGLSALTDRNIRRIELAKHVVEEATYCCQTVGFKRHPNLGFPFPLNGTHVFYVFPFLIHDFDRAEFVARMKKRGYVVGEGYIRPTLNRYKAFRKYQRIPLPVVGELSEKTLCLLYDLTPDKPLSYATKIAKAMRECLE